jgi:hypothetical protein
MEPKISFGGLIFNGVKTEKGAGRGIPAFGSVKDAILAPGESLPIHNESNNMEMILDITVRFRQKKEAAPVEVEGP